MQETDYTRHYIAEALLKLMKAKDFRDITVTEIVKRAGVGRPFTATLRIKNR